MPEEITVIVCADNVTNMEYDQLEEPAGVYDVVSPGSTPNGKDGSGSRSVSHNLVLETPIAMSQLLL